jgi:hypothetical protein
MNSDNPQHMPPRLAPFPPSILWQHVGEAESKNDANVANFAPEN